MRGVVRSCRMNNDAHNSSLDRSGNRAAFIRGTYLFVEAIAARSMRALNCIFYRMFWMDKQNLRTQIIDAFSSVPRPCAGAVTGHQCEECFELRDTFSPLNWETVPPEVIHDNSAQLSLFTHEAYRYFLPAYLLSCLDNFAPDNLVCEFVIYSLTPDNGDENQKQWIADRHGLLDRKQKGAIAAFLEQVLATESFKDFHAEVADGLQRYWVAPAENAI